MSDSGCLRIVSQVIRFCQFFSLVNFLEWVLEQVLANMLGGSLQAWVCCVAAVSSCEWKSIIRVTGRESRTSISRCSWAIQSGCGTFGYQWGHLHSCFHHSQCCPIAHHLAAVSTNLWTCSWNGEHNIMFPLPPHTQDFCYDFPIQFFTKFSPMPMY